MTTINHSQKDVSDQVLGANGKSDQHLVSKQAARLAGWSAIASVGFLALLHLLSPEFSPIYRMVSEYALGSHKWAITLMFVSWALGAFALASALRSITQSLRTKIGWGLLVLAGIGMLCGGLFPIDHPYHLFSFALGVPTLPLAALLWSAPLRNHPQLANHRQALRLATHLPWLSVVLMFAIVGIGLATGGQFGQEILVGIPNRLLVIAYNLWVAVVAWSLLADQ